MLTAIDAESVCKLIIKFRQFSVKMAPEVPLPADNPLDEAYHETLFAADDDPTEEEIRGTIAALSDDASAELCALVLLGRGDFAGDWHGALIAARDDPDLRTADALMGIPLLPSYLEEGLSELGYSCADLEFGRL
jgi:Protein of unknown function (DUF3775)